MPVLLYMLLVYILETLQRCYKACFYFMDEEIETQRR